MMYELLRTIHLIAVVPCIPLGAYLIYVSSKGAAVHRLSGKAYLILMAIQALVSLFMKARIGPQWLNHFGYIHLLTLITLVTIPYTLFKIRAGDIQAHKRSMVILFWSGLIVAGSFTLVPGRYLHEVLFN